MTVVIDWGNEHVRTFTDCTQQQINRMINYIQQLRDDDGLTTQVRITVTD